MSVTFTDEQWAEIDARIFRCNILGAIKEIRRFAGIGVSDAIVVHVERYRKLRVERPADFACTDEEYWRETYS
jgi:hypothetical protein